MKYKDLPHTADLRLEIYGKSLEKLFENSAEALAHILYRRSKKDKLYPSTSTKKNRIKSVKG